MGQSNSGDGGPDGEPDPDSGSGPGPRDPRLGWFASGGRCDRGLPDAGMTAVLEAVADGTGRPPPTASDDEVIGMLGRWQAVEAHAHARLLAVLRELIRRRADGCPASHPGELPGRWELGTAHEAAAELGISWQSADPLLALAWDLEARLPGTGRLLEAGVLTSLKVKIVSDEFAVLDDGKAAEAERLLLQEDLAAPAMTPARLRRLCQKLACTVDPDGARQRREAAERERARVVFFRNHGGDMAMFAEGLPADQALMAQASLQARALVYQRAGIDPAAGMDLLRVLAMLDLINGITAGERIARYRPGAPPAGTAGPPPAGTAGPPPAGTAGPPGSDDRQHDGPHDSPHGDDVDGAQGGGDADGGAGGGPGEGPGGDAGPGGRGPGEAPGADDPPARREPGLPALVHLTLPLATLTGLAGRPGEAPGFGALDPGLVRNLGTAAAASPRTRFCFSLTDEEGRAAGHACAKPIREPGGNRRRTGTPSGPAPGGRGSTSGGRNGPAPGGWDLEPDASRPGPGGGYGEWILTVPGGARYRLDIHPVPLHDCDHRLATPSYRPGALLRHLVEVRDGECSFTGCSHPAAQSDYEHSIPWGKGGPTDACNGASRSRRCHRVKQSRGWSVTQPEPARHLWHTPAGRTYEKGAKSYPS